MKHWVSVTFSLYIFSCNWKEGAITSVIKWSVYRYVAKYQQYQQEGANTNILIVMADKQIHNW